MTEQKGNEDLIYILADYKQLVLEYKSKYVSLVKKLHFWKTSCFWIFVLACSLGVAMFFGFTEAKRDLVDNKKSIAQLNKKIEGMSKSLDETQQDLLAAKQEVSKKEIWINKLEQNVSSTSKRLLEKMLTER